MATARVSCGGNHVISAPTIVQGLTSASRSVAEEQEGVKPQR